MSDYRQQARLYMDGNMWCAVMPGFRNLAIDDAGFGETPEDAVADLQRRVGAELSTDDFVRGDFCKKCKEWIADGISADGCRDPGCPCA